MFNFQASVCGAGITEVVTKGIYSLCFRHPQHEQWELPFPLTLQGMSHHPHTVLPPSSAEILILSFLTCLSL